MFLSCYICFLLNDLIMLYTFPIKQMFLSCYIRFYLLYINNVPEKLY